MWVLLVFASPLSTDKSDSIKLSFEIPILTYTLYIHIRPLPHSDTRKSLFPLPTIPSPTCSSTKKSIQWNQDTGLICTPTPTVRQIDTNKYQDKGQGKETKVGKGVEKGVEWGKMVGKVIGAWHGKVSIYLAWWNILTVPPSSRGIVLHRWKQANNSSYPLTDINKIGPTKGASTQCLGLYA